jgi:hypothetical protein
MDRDQEKKRKTDRAGAGMVLSACGCWIHGGGACYQAGAGMVPATRTLPHAAGARGAPPPRPHPKPCPEPRMGSCTGLSRRSIWSRRPSSGQGVSGSMPIWRRSVWEGGPWRGESGEGPTVVAGGGGAGGLAGWVGGAYVYISADCD